MEKSDFDDALQGLVEGLQVALGERLCGLVLYGAATSPDFQPGQERARVMVVLSTADAGTLMDARGPLEQARRAAGVMPYILRQGELARLADAFPVRVRSMKAHHRVMHGRDPFEEVSVKPADLRLRLEQELRNRLLRLRAAYVNTAEHLPSLRQQVLQQSRGLWMDLEAILSLRGVDVSEGSPREIRERYAQEYAGAEAGLAALEQVESSPLENASMMESILSLYENLVETVDGLAS